MPDENRVFDVTKPKDVSPSATSKPVIVGHHPMASDPMVNDTDKPAEEPTHIKILDGAPEPGSAEPTEHTALDNSPVPPDTAAIFSEPAAEPAEVAAPPEASAEPSVFPEAPSTEQAAESAAEPAPPAPPDDQALPEAAPASHPHIEELHFSDKNIKRSWWKPVLLVLLLLLIAAYLAIDSGLVRGYSHLPFHFFKQKTVTTSNSNTNTAPPTNNPAAASTPSIPAGFKDYQLSGTNLTFAAPLTWGTPVSAADPGYSKRGAGQQSDGTHAYVVGFASNKNIQLAVTSSKYLPAARDAQYYDYLQWCTGTNDGQFYQSTLHFTTSAGIDTPATIVCDQGPMTNVTKLDNNTIVQGRVVDSTGKTIGDIYTKNLSDPTLVVIRVKDAAMTNSAAIKQLLGTIQISPAQ